MNEVTIDGVRYVRADSVPAVPTGARAVVVVDRGWIWVGDVEDTADGRIRIHNALHLFKWERVGFAGVIEDPSAADIRTGAGTVDLPAGAELFRIPVGESWGL